MKNKREEQRLEVSNAVAKIFGMIMVVLYIAMGATIIFIANDQAAFPKKNVVIVGVAMILYGLFRAYRIYRNHFLRSNDEL